MFAIFDVLFMCVLINISKRQSFGGMDFQWNYICFINVSKIRWV